ncbi:uncharacterized protein K460DRAFT_353282 [Cucurbitaria berberidis CBS 394.84]|uniref:Uncharacterized protein n=1 Tax=Cucurbitaria berberidis CBS 394.84 TaxID=1168544 RepID=A0A9P4GMB9_9PLEO|nr:uncharacterized protein K460DRAFT_353282 [Cucurbitaria berberidis CBS 394.84]KAF1848282.1 hypothetical protein K460DRAFT_353282 [Cucurbitaria berberidis CBS 394.84]
MASNLSYAYMDLLTERGPEPHSTYRPLESTELVSAMVNEVGLINPLSPPNTSSPEYINTNGADLNTGHSPDCSNKSEKKKKGKEKKKPKKRKSVELTNETYQTLVDEF